MAPSHALRLIPSGIGTVHLVPRCNELPPWHVRVVLVQPPRNTAAPGDRNPAPITGGCLLSFPLPPLCHSPSRSARVLPFPRLSPSDTHTHSLPHFLRVTLSVNTALSMPCGWSGARAKEGVEGHYSWKVWLLLPPALNFKVQLKTKKIIQQCPPPCLAPQHPSKLLRHSPKSFGSLFTFPQPLSWGPS